MADEEMSHLEQAIIHLKRHTEEEGCSWCRSKSGAITELVQLAEELHQVSPIAHELSERIDNLRTDRIQELREQIAPEGIPASPPVRIPTEPEPTPTAGGGILQDFLSRRRREGGILSRMRSS